MPSGSRRSGGSHRSSSSSGGSHRSSFSSGGRHRSSSYSSGSSWKSSSSSRSSGWRSSSSSSSNNYYYTSPSWNNYGGSIFMSSRRSSSSHKGQSYIYGAVFAILAAVICLIISIALFSNNGMENYQYMNTIKTDYVYYQKMIKHAENNPEYIIDAEITDTHYNAEFDKWYYEYRFTNGITNIDLQMVHNIFMATPTVFTRLNKLQASLNVVQKLKLQ